MGVPIRGWIPRDRWAEDGRIADRYEGLVETESDDVSVRTELNVRDSDATDRRHRVDAAVRDEAPETVSRGRS
jgi:hypothetical protein